MIKLRPMRDDDLDFVFSSYLRSYKYGNPLADMISTGDFFHHQRLNIMAILASESSTAIVACLPDDEDIILGFAITEPQIVHFVYVKADWRNQGIAKEMLKEARVNLDIKTSFTHWTEYALYLDFKGRYPCLIYNPKLFNWKVPDEERSGYHPRICQHMHAHRPGKLDGASEGTRNRVYQSSNHKLASSD